MCARRVLRYLMVYMRDVFNAEALLDVLTEDVIAALVVVRFRTSLKACRYSDLGVDMRRRMLRRDAATAHF